MTLIDGKRKKPNPVDIYVGSRIRMRRNMIGMSQEKLGEHLGITFQQVQKYEKGANRVGASRLQQIAEVMEAPVSFFFDGLGGNNAPEGFAEGAADPMVDFCASAEGLQLMRAFTNIKDAKVRRKIIDLAKALSDEEGEERSGPSGLTG